MDKVSTRKWFNLLNIVHRTLENFLKVSKGKQLFAWLSFDNLHTFHNILQHLSVYKFIFLTNVLVKLINSL